MAYITQTDMESRYGAAEILQLTDRDGDQIHDDGVLDIAISDADALVDRYISKQAITPLVSPTEDIKRMSSDIARFYLYDDSAPEFVKNNYDFAVKELKRIASGDLEIVGVTGSKSQDIATIKRNHTRVFTEESLSGFL